MTIEHLLQKFQWSGIHLGLDRIRHLLAELGNPHERVPTIHVAGSNGKGSVCAYLSAVLTEAGYRTGRYTSPHLVSWCERICIDEQPVPPEELERVLNQVIDAIQPNAPSPTQFEVITAAAWLYFAQQKVDIAVVEVGLGGRLDATNVCDRPLASIIVSISREHWQRLGPTLADIAGEKAGILKPASPAVIGQLPPEARAAVDRRIAEVGCSVVYPEPAIWVDSEDWTGDSNQSSLLPNLPNLPPFPPCRWASSQGISYPLSLQGDIQLHNSALAIATLQLLRQQGWQIDGDQIARGMAKTRWAGRLQWFNWEGHKILLDGAHNPGGAAVLRQFIDPPPPSPSPLSSPSSPPPSTHWVIGMMSTKDHADVFKELLRPGDRLYLVPVPDAGTADPEALAVLAWDVCPQLGSCQTFPDVWAALKEATQPAPTAPAPTLTVLCGSLYLLGHFFSQQKP